MSRSGKDVSAFGTKAANFSEVSRVVSMSGHDDGELVHRARRGERRAFDEIVRRYQAALYDAAVRIVRDGDDAADIVQNAFVKAWCKLDTYNPRRRFFAWLYRIVVNEAINFARRASRHVEYESGIVLSREPEPIETLDEEELARRIEDAIAMLDIDYRIVIVLRHYHDFSYREMADIIGIPEKTVKSRLFTARQRLRHILSQGRLEP